MTIKHYIFGDLKVAGELYMNYFHKLKMHSYKINLKFWLIFNTNYETS